MHKLIPSIQARTDITLVLFFSIRACEFSIDTWVDDEYALQVTDEKDINFLEKKAIVKDLAVGC